ncbi:MAG: hypothetical protein WC314_09820 [Vulcanimicrobiota bacterium]
MLEAQKQQHLRTMRRSLNRAVTSLKEGSDVVCHSGWGYGRVFTHPWVEAKGKSEESLPEEEVTLLLPPSQPEELAEWSAILPPGVLPALAFFWPGPLLVRVRVPGGVRRLTVGCPWHPVMQELLERNGAALFQDLTGESKQHVEEGRELSGSDYESARLLRWPEEETPLEPSLLDLGTRPWRLLQQAFVKADELFPYLNEPVILSHERAFPERAIRTYVPEGSTLIVEADEAEQLPEAVRELRAQVPPDTFVRIYLDEQIAHTHFPDDREVRVYGELSDMERVRRRLQAMLERQNRRLGKRVLLIGVSNLGPGSESFQADLRKFSHGWLKVEDGVRLEL